MKKAFVNGKVILEDGIVENLSVLFDEEIIDLVKTFDETLYEVIDLEGLYISPGFVDIHIHGINGSDVMDGHLEALMNISSSLLKNGVTSYLATTMTLAKQDIRQAFATVKSYMKEKQSGAKLLGLHVEGPFINEAYKGAQNEKYIIAPDVSLVEPYTDNIKLITVAPEVDGMMDFVKSVKTLNENIQFSIGHSAATYEHAVEGFENGISSTTHLFNGMTGLHHRKPGIVGAVFKKKPYFEIIADQVHLHAALYDIVGDAVGIDKMILITDAMCACQMAPGEYELGGQSVIVDHNSARLKNGSLAGSILKMNDAIKNVENHTHYSLSDVVNMASRNPSNLLGLKNIGVIKKGNQADFAVFDNEMQIHMTFVNGQNVYRKDI